MAPSLQRVLGHTLNILGARDGILAKSKDPGWKAEHPGLKQRLKEYDASLASYKAQWQAATPDQQKAAKEFLFQELRQTRSEVDADYHLDVVAATAKFLAKKGA